MNDRSAIDALDLATVAERGGLTARGRNSWGPCPVCHEEKRGREDRRGPLAFSARLWKCHAGGCPAGGDAVALAAALKYGETLGKGDPRWRELLTELGGDTSAPPTQRRAAPAQPEPEPERVYPPVEDVDALWGCCWPLLDVEVSPVGQVHGFIRSRALDPAMMQHRDVVRVLRPGFTPEWMPHLGHTTHRLVVPMFDHHGRRRSLRFRSLSGDVKIKALPPTGFNIGGLVMADPMAQSLLTGDLGVGSTLWDGRVVVTEGEPDFWTWSSNDARWSAEVDKGETYAVFGIVAGSWTSAIADRIPTGTTVVIRTDHDLAGDKYARTIASSLSTRCRIVRSEAPRA